MPSGIETCEVAGVRFRHPGDWTRELEYGEDGVTVSLQSTGVSFALVGVYPAERKPADLVEQVLDSLRDEHPTLEAEDFEEAEGDDFGDEPLEAMFISLDMVSYCWVAAKPVGDRTALVVVQSIEPEAARGRLVFRALRATLTAVE
jgi:hypothetical protein